MAEPEIGTPPDGDTVEFGDGAFDADAGPAIRLVADGSRFLSVLLRRWR
jgi:hypothetical protein